MKKYDTYKDSGIEWIGEIPEHWKVSKVKYNFSFNTGFTPPSGKAEYYDNGSHVWINISDLQKKHINDSVNKITDKAIEDYKPEIIPKNSLLYSFKLSIGRVGFNTIDCYTNEAIFSIHPDDNTNLGFFYYSLPKQIIHNANENIYGAKILNQELIKNAFLIIPPPKEQTAIASYLDQKTSEIDELIADKEELLKLYEEEKTALINQAVTKGIDPNVKMKDSGIDWLGEIPEHWESVSLKWVSKIYSGGTPSRKRLDFWENGTIPWLNSGTVNQFFITEPSEYITIDGLNKSSAKWIPEGSILIALAGQGKTKGMVAQVMFKSTCNQSMGIIVPNEKVINRFLLYYLKNNYQNIRNLGGGDKRDGINLEMVGGIYIPLLSLKEQQSIVNYIESETARLDDKINNTERLIELLKEYREALISEVVTGKVKVI